MIMITEVSTTRIVPRKISKLKRDMVLVHPPIGVALFTTPVAVYIDVAKIGFRLACFCIIPNDAHGHLFQVLLPILGDQDCLSVRQVSCLDRLVYEGRIFGKNGLQGWTAVNHFRAEVIGRSCVNHINALLELIERNFVDGAAAFLRSHILDYSGRGDWLNPILWKSHVT